MDMVMFIVMVMVMDRVMAMVKGRVRARVRVSVMVMVMVRIPFRAKLVRNVYNVDFWVQLYLSSVVTSVHRCIVRVRCG